MAGAVIIIVALAALFLTSTRPCSVCGSSMVTIVVLLAGGSRMWERACFVPARPHRATTHGIAQRRQKRIRSGARQLADFVHKLLEIQRFMKHPISLER